MNTQEVQSAGIASITPAKAKRKYTKRRTKAKVVRITPKARKELPKTASAYLRTLGMAVDKESAAVSELIRIHDELRKKERKDYELLAVVTAPDPATNTYVFTKPGEPVVDGSLWGRFKGWLSK
jgi:hypothetical protein